MGKGFSKIASECVGPHWMCENAGTIVSGITNNGEINNITSGDPESMAQEDSFFQNGLNSILPNSTIQYNKMGISQDTLNQQSTRDTSLINDRVGRLGNAHF